MKILPLLFIFAFPVNASLEMPHIGSYQTQIHRQEANHLRVAAATNSAPFGVISLNLTMVARGRFDTIVLDRFNVARSYFTTIGISWVAKWF